MHKSLFLMALMLGLTACGGGGDGGGSDGGDQPTDRFTATTTTTVGGRLLPASLQLAAGQSGTFRIEAATGYRLDSITGCDGRLDGDHYTLWRRSAQTAPSAPPLSVMPPRPSATKTTPRHPPTS
ncbi:MAG: hypothetical protein LRY38_09040 [Aeromonadaceae bacterium]|nr:hypothetical protein [Aeromonadaceae bacterium]